MKTPEDDITKAICEHLNNRNIGVKSVPALSSESEMESASDDNPHGMVFVRTFGDQAGDLKGKIQKDITLRFGILIVAKDLYGKIGTISIKAAIINAMTKFAYLGRAFEYNGSQPGWKVESEQLTVHVIMYSIILQYPTHFV